MKKTFFTRQRRKKLSRQRLLTNAAYFLIILFPIYPVFGSYLQIYTGVVVRGEYNSASILASYDWEKGEEFSRNEEVIIDKAPISQLIDPETLAKEENSVPNPIVAPVQKTPEDPKKSLYVTHTVTKGDTLSTIAEKYRIPLSTLRTMNNLTSDLLSISQKIIIPRIDGVQYVVKQGDTLSGIAARYGVSNMNNILLASDMKSGSVLKVGRTLLIPNPTKDPNKKVVVNKPTTSVKPQAVVKAAPKTPRKDPETISYGSYTLSLKVTKGCRSFAWGNCTCFVAKYKNVTWRGNAKEWLNNAKKQGVPTGNTPKPGAIAVYRGHGFPPAYGHVSIVMEVQGDEQVVKDMNYRALNEVTTRRESIHHPAIIGYIYVD